MQLAEVLKLKLDTDRATDQKFEDMAWQYMLACDMISKYVFTHDFERNSVVLSGALYHTIREEFGLKAQMAQSAIRTVTARYKAVDTQYKKKPYKFRADGKKYTCQRDVHWLWKPISFHRPQADLVRNRDYSFVDGGQTISINTLAGRVRCTFAQPATMPMRRFLDGTWKFSTAKLVRLKGNWYLHVSAVREALDFTRDDVRQVVGIDRGLRFLATAYDSDQKTHFFDGKAIIHKRRVFDNVRARLQAKGTKSAKRVLKRVSGRENRWMSDVNHQISKTLVSRYGKGTLFVLEDLEDVSSDDRNFYSKEQAHSLRNWAFYDLETKLSYKADEAGSKMIKVSPDYTSQRCPHCGRIRKDNRDHALHRYVCDRCGFTTNDDRVGAMNIWLLGTLWVSGDNDPSFKTKTKEKQAPA